MWERGSSPIKTNWLVVDSDDAAFWFGLFAQWFMAA